VKNTTVYDYPAKDKKLQRSQKGDIIHHHISQLCVENFLSLQGANYHSVNLVELNLMAHAAHAATL